MQDDFTFRAAPHYSLVVAAHAKINLALAVGPPEPPRNFHPIASWFVPIALHDDIRITILKPGSLSSAHVRWAADAPKPSPIDWPIEKDLAVRAHRALEAHIGRPLPIELSINKRIPVGGGLGGGSSDAAAVFRIVNHHFGLQLSTDDLRELSRSLGSDIAFFLHDGPLDCPPPAAIVSGLGERIERLPAMKSHRLVLLIPPFGCPTGPVYQAFDALPRQPLDSRRVAALARASHLDSSALFNDLAPAACAVRPELASILRRLQALPETVHITGSGSTMFVIAEEARLQLIQAELAALCPDVFVLFSRTL